MKRLLFLIALWVGFAGLEAGAPTPEPTPRPSFLDPVGDFARDTILRPVAPFELVPGKDPNGWGFVIEPYAWALGLEGDIAAKGLPPGHVNFSSRTILQHLDWGIFARGEVRKGRWGLLADGYYAALSASANPSNKIYDRFDLGLQQSLVSLAIAYRVIDDRRGYLDLYAGARYNFLGTQVSASVNEARISEIGDHVAAALAQRADARLEAAVSAAVARAGAAAANLQSELVGAVGERLRERELRRLLLGDRDLRQLMRSDVLRRQIAGGAVNDAFRNYVRASAQAKAAAAKGIVDAALEAAAKKAQSRLSKEIAKRIEESTPTYAAGDQWWFDPIVGVRGQLNFTRWLFLAAQGDVGGFGAGSQIAWNVQTTLGVNFTRNVFGEIGYRYMYVDYSNGGFLYNMNSYGLFSGLGVRF